MAYERIPLDRFAKSFTGFIGACALNLELFLSPETYLIYIELSSVALGGKICSVPDEFFAEAYHLLLVEVRAATFLPPDLCRDMPTMHAHLPSHEAPAGRFAEQRWPDVVLVEWGNEHRPQLDSVLGLRKWNAGEEMFVIA